MGTAVLVKVSIRRVGGGLGLSCGGKNFCERADFEEFLAIWRKNNGKVLISEFFFAVLSWHGKNASKRH